MTFSTNPKPEPHKRTKARRKRAQRKADKAVYQAVTQLFEDGCCMKCGRFGVQLHHRVFRSLGGKTTVENIQPLCKFHHAEAHRL